MRMDICTTIPDLRRKRGDTTGAVALVPTMGALHAGHLSLIDCAREHVGRSGTVIVSLFVNPAQFGPDEDLERYPRTFDADAQACRARGVDLLFAPGADEMYPPDHSTSVRETSLSQGLCGAARPGHFNGVCTIVLKLFLLTRPDLAVFGRKDYQQLAVIRRMTRDLNVPLEIIAAPTIREKDGLALSSRNRYLTPNHREQASALYRALRRARQAFANGETKPARLLEHVAAFLRANAPEARLDYLELADRDTLETEGQADHNSILLAALWLGSTRLIDNLELAGDSLAGKEADATP